MTRRGLGLLLFALSIVVGGGPARAEDPGPLRVAVVVGANAAAPGRRPLRFAHRDAEGLAEVLRAVGGFREPDVRVLKDPAPAALLAAVAEGLGALAGKPDSLFYFYYSGHADERALFPAGEPLPVRDLQRLLDGAKVSVKVGMVDACRGGGWTRAKGLSLGEPFSVPVPVTLGNEGSVLIASSSGLESAHESDVLQGSFFTHHFGAGLRGAADQNADGQITLTEVFEYAKVRTISDTVRLAPETQHPSYAVNLRGRRDLVLARLQASPSTVVLSQEEGPLQVIHMETGLLLIELPSGPRQVKLAVPAGRYLVRKSGRWGTRLKEITVAGAAPTLVAEGELTLLPTPRLAVKDAPLVAERARVPPTGRDEARAAPASALVKVGTIASATGAAVAFGLGVKWALDVERANREIDPYRRFDCLESRFGCDASGKPLSGPRTQEQEAYVDALRSDGRAKDRLSRIAYATGGALALTSAVLGYFWFAGGDEAPVAVAPTWGPAGAGLGARVGF
jgi:hypothetical protein